MVKQYVVILLVLLLLCGCAKESPADALPVETTPETIMPDETGPELEYMTAEANGIPAVLATLSRGDTVYVVGSLDEKHHIVKLDTGYGMVEKNLVRLEGETPFEPWFGYSYHNAEVYDNYRLVDEPVKKLPSNTKVEVLDDLGWCLLVRYDGNDGYMKPEKLSRFSRNGGSGTSKDNGGGAGNESSSGSSDIGEDGGDIWLQSSWEVTRLSVITPQHGDAVGKATVLADGTEVILGYFDRGDRIPVVKQNVSGDRLTVCLDGLYASVSGAYIRAEEAPDYEAWKGSSKYYAEIYEDFWMTGSPIDRLNANTEVTVLYELEHCYLVEAEGVTGYVLKDMVLAQEEDSAPKVPEQAPQTQQNTTTTKPGNGNSGSTKPESGNTSSSGSSTGDTKPESGNKPVPDSGSGGNTTPESGNTPAPEDKPSDDSSGGNTGSSSGNSDPEWTPPVL